MVSVHENIVHAWTHLYIRLWCVSLSIWMTVSTEALSTGDRCRSLYTRKLVMYEHTFAFVPCRLTNLNDDVHRNIVHGDGVICQNFVHEENCPCTSTLSCSCCNGSPGWMTCLPGIVHGDVVLVDSGCRSFSTRTMSMYEHSLCVCSCCVGLSCWMMVSNGELSTRTI